MIVAKLYVCRTCIGPCEAQSVLVVDADAVLPRTIGAQWFQTVGRFICEGCQAEIRLTYHDKLALFEKHAHLAQQAASFP